MNGTHLPNTIFERRCYDLYNRFCRCGIRPAYIELRVAKQAMLEATHNLKQRLRSRAHRRHAKKHDELTMQAKAWKAKYDSARKLGERFVHAEPKPHELIVALRKSTL